MMATWPDRGLARSREGLRGRYGGLQGSSCGDSKLLRAIPAPSLIVPMDWVTTLASSLPSEPAINMSDPIFDQERLECPPTLDYRVEQLVPVVVGAHPRAEIADRPWADRLVRLMRASLRTRGLELAGGPIPLVMTDVWYLNDEALRLQPTIAIGDPSVNATSAYFANRLPCAYAIENACQLLLDPELLEPRVCLWGVDDESAGLAMERFETRWLEEFLDAVENVVEA